MRRRRCTHREISEGEHDRWSEGNYTFADEIVEEFETDDEGNIRLTPDELRDIIAYTAIEYYG